MQNRLTLSLGVFAAVFFLAEALLALTGEFKAYPEQKVKDFYLSNFTEDGTREWEVEGDEAIIHDEYVDIEEMKANYYPENDTILITSNKARLNKTNMDVELKEDVHISNQDGATLVTDSLNWQREKNFINTSDRVKTTRDSLQITATGLSADTQLKEADFEKDVEVIFSDAQRGGVSTATCSGPLEIEYNKGIAIFNQDVVFVDREGKLYCDKATFFFNTEDKTIIKVIAVGNVKILRGQNITYADKATYYEAGQRIVLEGRPRVIYYPQEGDRAGSLFGKQDK